MRAGTRALLDTVAGILVAAALIVDAVANLVDPGAGHA
ncbi:hypothetical protein SEA_DELRIO_56 [Gordonia phage DelRio]|uniref:Uncharacterized protein n=1 Tax=Gordonia phage BetterKatz TaxID=1821551 RepID=A0A142KC57_9CAUD|nr:hypothetical protein BJD67_gp55 [Gordonia phage BetterKatz]AMS03690.1 hypothetical protein SEA_BETTERKATZ_55 [Gordonia phage BetterKatz]AXH47276.1 hypothetical protein SEA_DELRIO_56 [Gordonia phage DelRio]